MKIKEFFNKNLIENNELHSIQKGKWNDWHRAFVIGEKSSEKVGVVTLNVFERMLWTVLKCFHVNYFPKFGKEVYVIQSDSLNEQTQKTDKQKQTLSNSENQKNLPQQPMDRTSKEEIPKEQETIEKRSEKKDPLSDDMFLRIMSYEIQGYQPDLALYQSLIPAFERYKLDKETQKQLGDHDPSLYIFIDFNDFGKKNKLHDFHLNFFVQYLVLKDHIIGYTPARGLGAYRLDLVNPNVKEIPTVDGPQTLRTKDFLLKLDEYMQQIKLPKVEDFKKEDQEIASTALKAIKYSHYQKAIGKRQDRIVEISELKFPIDKERITQVLDDLVKKGIILSWNRFYGGQNPVCIKMFENDQADKDSLFQFNEWRNLKIIASEGFRW